MTGFPSRRVTLGLSRGGEMHVSLPGAPGVPVDEETMEALREIGEAALGRMLAETCGGCGDPAYCAEHGCQDSGVYGDQRDDVSQGWLGP